MISRAKLGVEHDGGESWIVELVLPGVFTLILMICLAHLAYSAFQAQMHQVRTVDYAISAFAN
jgi:hypothetical protein